MTLIVLAHIYEILRDEIKADVSDWANYKKGKTAPASNPKYCYEWCFTQSDRVVVLNLWHASLAADGDDVVCELNMRAYANEIARARDEPWRDKKPKPVWEKRARSMDLAIQLAVRKRLPIRVIVCEGDMRGFASGDERASEVKRRVLDPLHWGIDSYAPDTGRTILRRGHTGRPLDSADPLAVRPTAPAASAGVQPAPAEPLAAEIATTPFIPPEPVYTDQFDEDFSRPPERREIAGSAFVRSPDVRAAALRRARGLCQLCGQPGFMTTAGKLYLETHHVIPLGEGGADAVWNVVALCATDHRRAHFEADSARLKLLLLDLARGG
ncbi:HNH endonuclease [Paucibacter sp. DJ4R-1]|nr:HNH endonuclease [Paucibacter sp. DJ4R-1]